MTSHHDPQEHDEAIRKRLEAGPTIQRILCETEAFAQERRMKRARENPAANKLSRDFPKNSNYRYWQSTRCANETVRICYSSWKNAAGYYLTWRETTYSDGNGRRDRWAAHKTRKAASAFAKRWADDLERGVAV